VPESFKVLVKELQALALNVTVYDDENIEIDLKQDFDDEEDGGFVNEAEFEMVNDAGDADGYMLDENEDDDIFAVPSALTDPFAADEFAAESEDFLPGGAEFDPDEF
jgi:DNA-directed RNA polymerase subunit beta